LHEFPAQIDSNQVVTSLKEKRPCLKYRSNLTERHPRAAHMKAHSSPVIAREPSHMDISAMCGRVVLFVNYATQLSHKSQACDYFYWTALSLKARCVGTDPYLVGYPLIFPNFRGTLRGHGRRDKHRRPEMYCETNMYLYIQDPVAVQGTDIKYQFDL